MPNEVNEFTAGMEEDQELLPSGWGEGDDFFDVDSWIGAASADESKTGEESQDEDSTPDERVDNRGTTTAEDDAGDSNDAETPTTQDGKGKLKFSATVDHESKEVELDEAELPTIYQKAQVTDRVQAKVARMQPVYDKVLRTAKILGYSTPEEMLTAAEDNFRDGEVERLINEGTQRDVAEDYVRRKMNDATVKEEQEKAPEATPNGRDFKSEVEALLDIRPELRVPGTKLPDEVTTACIETGRPLAVVYLEWEAKQEKARYEKLLSENKKLKKNAEAASRAPVRGVSKGGPTDMKPDDDFFLKGFNSDD